MILALGMLKRLPLVPAVSRNAPMDAAKPKQYVETSALHICSTHCLRQVRQQQARHLSSGANASDGVRQGAIS